MNGDIQSNTDSSFISRHIGATKAQKTEMLERVGVRSMDELIDQTIPTHIRVSLPENFTPGKSEYEYGEHLRSLAAQNHVCKSYIGQGYYPVILPPVIKRHILENPGWYTQYTPYQAEIAQGRLESLFYFQSMICDLTRLPIANASLLDEGTAAAEAMAMLLAESGKDPKKEKARFFIDRYIFTQTKHVLRSRADALGVEIVEGDALNGTLSLGDEYFGACAQYPNSEGNIADYDLFIRACKKSNIGVCLIADLMSLCLLKPPGALGADIAVGSSQRFGIPMGYGGPHAAYMACKEHLKRLLPGRIIGESIDKNGKPAYRMALQTREQHIRREKATSNICTAQALLANMAVMYAIYHGAEGLRRIALRISALTHFLSEQIKNIKGVSLVHSYYFDTIKIKVDDISAARERALRQGVNLHYCEDDAHIQISLHEASAADDINELIEIIGGKKNSSLPPFSIEKNAIPTPLRRAGDFLTHSIFNSFQDETQMMRFIKRLEQKDLSLTTSMIPLGSCTMKLNAVAELECLSMPAFSDIHPLAPKEQTKGYRQILKELANYLCQITGLDACSLQPNSGAQGEFAGLLCIKKYLRSIGEERRNIILIPISAHGTNPASAKMAGFEVAVVKCSPSGEIDIDHLQELIRQHGSTVAGLMATYPSTYGIFDENIKKICDIIHESGGLVYMDGANMNAQVGLSSPAFIGADVCHINLHKTFAIPHGGGGPGMGPICVKKQLATFLPSTENFNPNADKETSYFISSSPFGSASICIISYGYIQMMGKKGLTEASRYAILNANYMRKRLEAHYPILFVNKNGMCAHEFIVDCRGFKQKASVEVEDIAKRLMDYGFHAPTISFPVPGTMMIEPTESENKGELDRFCDALISIREEISEIEKGNMPSDNNPLKNAPHSYETLCSDTWPYRYGREQAAFPLPFIREKKFWIPVSRINQAYGDRNLVCSCIPISEYIQ